MNTNKLLELTKLYLEKNITDVEEKEVYIIQDILDSHNHLYYNSNTPVISDFEYDSLFKKLQQLEINFSVSWKQTNRVGAELVQSSFEKVAQSRAMISLDNTYNAEDLRDFDERVKRNLWGREWNLEYMIEFKFDGVGIELIYEDGNFIQAITRWNGIAGEDVTENVRQIQSIPKRIPYNDRFEIRWEILMPISSFEYLNKKAKKDGWKIFSNPSFSASVMRCSTLLIGLISPDKPTSAAKHTFGFMAMSWLDDNIAATTAKSIAGSSTLIPPVTFKKTSFALFCAKTSRLSGLLFYQYQYWLIRVR